MTLKITDFIQEPAETYHQQAKTFLSSHQLIDYIKCPYGYLLKRQKPQDDTPSFFLGRAVHQYVLEGPDEFAKNYIIGGPVNEKTGRPYGTSTQKYKEWFAERQAEGKAGVSDEDYDLIQTVNFSVNGHADAANLIDDGFPEAVLRTNYCGANCQIRIDWFNPELNALIDLKTCRNIDRFQYDFRDYMYANQMAFYQAVFELSFDFKPDVFIIATEVCEPYRTGVFKITTGTLEEARQMNEANIPKFLESKETGRYPTLYEEIRVL